MPSLAGPTRPQDRVRLDEAKRNLREVLPRWTGRRSGALDDGVAETFPASDPVSRVARRPCPNGRSVPVEVALEGGEQLSQLDHGHVVIAAITSCTNTSNPAVMIAAGLLAKNAVDRGLERKPWVKTSLAPGSRVVMDYYERAGLVPYLEKLGYNLVGYGCTTCIGNSGPAGGRDQRRDRRARPRGVLGAVRATATSRAASTPTPS